MSAQPTSSSVAAPQAPLNADPMELAKFSELAHRWWDVDGEFGPLHAINPLRLDWIDGIAPLKVSRWGSDDPAELDAMRDPDGMGWRIDREQEVAGIDLGEHAETAYDLVARGGRIGASGHGRPHDARHHGDETIDTDPTDTPTQGALA